MNIIDDMWYKYDVDSSGYIDKSEFYQFVKDTMGDEDLKELLIKNEIKETGNDAIIEKGSLDKIYTEKLN